MVARAEALAKPLASNPSGRRRGAVLVLTSFIVGIKTVDTNEALSFITRFVAWASIVVTASFGASDCRSGLPTAALASLAVAVALAACCSGAVQPRTLPPVEDRSSIGSS